MKRFACVAAVCLVAFLGVGVRSAHAQATPGAADSKFYAEFNFGPTLGHKSDRFFGGELGYRLTPELDVFVEVSHMNNVGTTELDDRATTIANYLGGTASTAYKANIFAFGVRYNFTVTSKIQPVRAGGVGVAHVTTEVEFTVNGTTIDPGPAGCPARRRPVRSTNKTIFVFGFGANMPFKETLLCRPRLSLRPDSLEDRRTTRPTRVDSHPAHRAGRRRPLLAASRAAQLLL